MGDDKCINIQSEVGIELFDKSQFGCVGFSRCSDGSKEKCFFFIPINIKLQQSRPKYLKSLQSN